ncbi:MAG: haloacid dehalogenase type II [Actinomycetota bacterium]|nr:haloacid dehalogenase type II [Actinomycetota bacterium]
MSDRPTAVAFDVNETLFSLERMGERLADAGLADGALQIWFTRVLRDGLALAATGDYHPFRALAAGHLAHLLDAEGLDADVHRVDAVLSHFAELDAQPDAEPALRRLREEGLPVVTLTNGHAETVGAMLEHARLDGLVDARLSVDEVGLWKPRPEPYHMAARHLGVEPRRLALVSVHSWDIHGANRAGLVTGYANRMEGSFLPGFEEPDVSGAELVEVVDGLLALPPA